MSNLTKPPIWNPSGTQVVISNADIHAIMLMRKNQQQPIKQVPQGLCSEVVLTAIHKMMEK